MPASLPCRSALGVEAASGWLRVPLLVLTTLLPLAVVPGLEAPFSSPKLVLMGLAASAGWILMGRQCLAGWSQLPAEFRLALAAWLGALGASAAFGSVDSLTALLLPLFAVGWFLLVVSVRPRAEVLALALVVSGTVVACLALLQFAGADPFALAGWAPAGAPQARMRVYATLGNPNFVAAFLVGGLPLTIFLQKRLQVTRWVVSLVLVAQVGAILATGSRGVLPGLGACLVWLAVVEPPGRWRQFGVLAVVVGVLTLAFAPSRPLKTTLQGRWYVWGIAAPHVSERPLLGWGPGGFAAKYPEWETERWARRPPSSSDRAFVGLQDHAHNDYLEILIDLGAAGLLAFLAVLALFLRFACRVVSPAGKELIVGASGGAIALAGVALVDFPFMRPAELFLFWSLLAVAFLAASPGKQGRVLDAEPNA